MGAAKGFASLDSAQSCGFHVPPMVGEPQTAPWNLCFPKSTVWSPMSEPNEVPAMISGGSPTCCCRARGGSSRIGGHPVLMDRLANLMKSFVSSTMWLKLLTCARLVPVEVAHAVIEQVVRDPAEAFSAQPLVQRQIPAAVIADAVQTQHDSAHRDLLGRVVTEVQQRLPSSVGEPALYKVNSEPVIKKLAVINYLAVVRKMRATIEHFYPNLAATAYNSKRTTILRWARNRNKLEAAAAAGKGEHKKRSMQPCETSALSVCITLIKQLYFLICCQEDGNAPRPEDCVKPSKDKAIQEENNARRYGFGIRNWKNVRTIRETTGLEVYGNAKGTC
ncbi:hypothetical protein PF008_g10850 [Phytophthora fragariae]|uniref:Uncharacterized protein n=1 Tax=Phytophthora fragariae TaxID=53985 RepID=A0A6G0RT23_9STRA|nr:hypothetical protein PF008_g10850 [Phytophthora fragariae]